MQKIIEIHETFIKNKFYVLWSMTDRPAVKWIIYWMLIVTGYLQQKFLLCILNCSRINHIFSIASWTDGPINNKVASSLKKQTTLLELDERQVVVDSRIFFCNYQVFRAGCRRFLMIFQINIVCSSPSAFLLYTPGCMHNHIHFLSICSCWYSSWQKL